MKGLAGLIEPIEEQVSVFIELVIDQLEERSLPLFGVCGVIFLSHKVLS